MSARNEATATPTPERIRIALAIHGVSAVELARECGIHPTALSRILNERETLPAASLARIHRTLLRIVLRRSSAGDAGSAERRADSDEEGWAAKTSEKATRRSGSTVARQTATRSAQ